jgi:hypothetical protein
MYQAADEGFFSGVDPLLGALLDREPRTVREVLAPADRPLDDCQGLDAQSPDPDDLLP